MTTDKRTAMTMAAAHIGAVAALFLIFTLFVDVQDFWRGFPVGLALVSLVVLLIRKLRDEFVEQMWLAGASLAFYAVVAWFFFGPLIEGLVDGVGTHATLFDLPAQTGGLVAITAFFLGFHLKWLRTRA